MYNLIQPPSYVVRFLRTEGSPAVPKKHQPHFHFHCCPEMDGLDVPEFFRTSLSWGRLLRSHCGLFRGLIRIIYASGRRRCRSAATVDMSFLPPNVDSISCATATQSGRRARVTATACRKSVSSDRDRGNDRRGRQKKMNEAEAIEAKGERKEALGFMK